MPPPLQGGGVLTEAEELDLTAHTSTIRPTHPTRRREAKFAVATLALLLIGARSGFAQATTAPIEHLEVALWPEFDQPAMLVIYRFEIAADAPLPAQVSLPVPAASGQPHAVAWLSAGGGLFDAAFTSASAGDWQIIQVELNESRSGQLEYYADMDFTGTTRSFLFDWPNGFDLGGMSYKVQEPIAATDLVVRPAPDGEGLGDFGLNYLIADIGPQPADSAPTISVTYQKVDPRLSIDLLQPLGEISATDDLPLDNPNILPWLVGAVGIALLGGVAYYFVIRGRPMPRRVSSRRRNQTSKVVELEASTVFCHQCGAAAGISDVYCRQCGTKLRHR